MDARILTWWRVFEGSQGFMTSKPRILIVEDDMPVAMMIAYLLTRAQCEVAFAHTAKKGIKLAEEGSFDLITLDVDLPDGNGFKICSRLKRHPRLRDTPIIFLSARCLIEDQQHGLELGAADYITKPFEASEFVPRLLSHIKRRNDFHSVAESESVKT
jgi:putative two-component system response regulator